MGKAYSIMQKLSNLVQEQSEESEKMQKVRTQKNKVEKEVRLRQSKRERNSNFFKKTEQRLQQQINRHCAEIKALQLKMTSMKKEEKKEEELKAFGDELLK